MIFLHELGGILALSIAFALVFLLGEFLRRKVKISPEASRKTVHIGGCLVALTLPAALKSHWSVLVMAIIATLAILVGKRRRLLPSLDDVTRETRGSIYHPIAIYLCFLIAQLLQRPSYFVIAMLVMGLSDSIAALTGVAYGRKKYLVEGADTKSIEGSVCFFLSTFIIVEIALLLFSPDGRLDCILVALLIAILVTMFEAISLQGADNLAVPLGTIFILAKNTPPDTSAILIQFAVLAIALLYAAVVAYPFAKVSSTGVLSMALAIYTAGGLVNYRWMLPMAVASFAFCQTRWFIQEGTPPNRARPAFYLLVVPIFWILCANFLMKKAASPELASPNWLFPSFITAVISQMLLSRRNNALARHHAYGTIQLLRDTVLLNLPILVGGAFLARDAPGEMFVFCLLSAFLDFMVVQCFAWLQRRKAFVDDCYILRVRMLLVFSASLVLAIAMLQWRLACRN